MKNWQPLRNSIILVQLSTLRGQPTSDVNYLIQSRTTLPWHQSLHKYGSVFWRADCVLPHLPTIQLFSRYSVHIQQQFLNSTQAKPVLAAAETRVGGLQVWESIHTALTDRISRKHCNRQNVISHHSFSYFNCFGLYHKITLISKTPLLVTT